MDSGDVRRALDGSLTLLHGAAAQNSWTAPAGGLEWTCLATAEHIAHDLTAYATQLAARATDAYLPLDLVVRPGTPPRTVLSTVAACGRLLALELDAAGPAATAWHWGPTDRTGFAALGVNEILVHTWDIAQGLGRPWTPPPDLAAAVLSRLFPDVPPDTDPDAGRALLWATGRIALAGRPRRESWVVKAARR
ncbi:maleylpyruvate isomerase N-terminal domain-containing protein [Dactylosporangium sp. NPDC049140]|uniref:maleylpyruvate isomerase N-terminal domain-containing protein n=1 Tax=Dactylosporangium sp. NPDC049140 TaxID=3155647 RepID=UPI0033EA7A2C